MGILAKNGCLPNYNFSYLSAKFEYGSNGRCDNESQVITILHIFKFVLIR